MSFLGHLKKLINTRLDEDVSSAEDPAVAVRSLVRDMREHLSGARAALSVMSRDERRLKAELVKLDRERKQWHKKAESALLSKDEQTARKCLRHKIAAQKCHDEIKIEHDKLAANCRKLDKAVRLLQERLKEATAREKAVLARIRRIKRAEFLKDRFPMHKELAIKMALEELDYDTERRLHASFLLEEDSLDRTFEELASDDMLVTRELKQLKKKLPED